MPMLQLFLPKTGAGNACVYYKIRCRFRSFPGRAFLYGCSKYHSKEKGIPGISSFAFYYCFSCFFLCFFSRFSLSFLACFFFSVFLSCFSCFFPFWPWTKEKKKGRQKENATGIFLMLFLPLALFYFKGSGFLFRYLPFVILLELALLLYTALDYLILLLSSPGSEDKQKCKTSG